ncbi:SDR family NAD(P)-dependent oxidoreductase [Sphaerisporangium viridialbum]|uniref:SDR family NAD(P)-dependent oxidoreductase n=1 Tax=Sphaerisporangium viridialbum TaxID=46189 RepID=UPI003C7968C0
MELQLIGKTVLITGSSAGIGFAAAVGFAREGASVILNGRNEARLKESRARLLNAVPDAAVRVVAADVGTASGCQALIDAVPEVDVLVNNAAVFEPEKFEAISDAEWMRYFETNVMSGVRLARHHLARMVARNQGRILFVSSEAAVQVSPEMMHYAMTKTALLAVARGLAELTRGTNVTVNTVLPGPTATEGIDDFMRTLASEQGLSDKELKENFFATARSTSLLQRWATPEEVAHLLVYLGSPLAAATNGAAVRVEGGVLRSIL